MLNHQRSIFIAMNGPRSKCEQVFKVLTDRSMAAAMEAGSGRSDLECFQEGNKLTERTRVVIDSLIVLAGDSRCLICAGC